MDARTFRTYVTLQQAQAAKNMALMVPRLTPVITLPKMDAKTFQARIAMQRDEAAREEAMMNAAFQATRITTQGTEAVMDKAMMDARVFQATNITTQQADSEDEVMMDVGFFQDANITAQRAQLAKQEEMTLSTMKARAFLTDFTMQHAQDAEEEAMMLSAMMDIDDDTHVVIGQTRAQQSGASSKATVEDLQAKEALAKLRKERIRHGLKVSRAARAARASGSGGYPPRPGTSSNAEATCWSACCRRKNAVMGSRISRRALLERRLKARGTCYEPPADNHDYDDDDEQLHMLATHETGFKQVGSMQGLSASLLGGALPIRTKPAM